MAYNTPSTPIDTPGSESVWNEGANQWTIAALDTTISIRPEALRTIAEEFAKAEESDRPLGQSGGLLMGKRSSEERHSIEIETVDIYRAGELQSVLQAV